MKNIIYVLASFLLLACDPGEVPKSPNLGFVDMQLNNMERNGDQMEYSIKVRPKDTIDLSFEIRVKYQYETVRLDSIVAVPEYDQNYTGHQDVINLFNDKLSFTLIPELAIGNQNSIEELRIIMPDFDLDSDVYNHIGLRWVFTLYGSHTEQITNDDEPIEPSSAEVGIEIENSYTNYKFRLYNNYVGKDPNDSTGVGYNPITREYIHDLCALYSSSETECSIGQALLINLTYDENFNMEGKVFIPAFGFGQNITNLYEFILSEGNSFNWERLHLLESYDRYITSSRHIVDVEIGLEIFILRSSNEVALRVTDIVEGGLESYVEFEVAINNADFK
ncbi:hypothetical protein JKA74_06930 [Marivirga sp. S37H4]|uniref:Uncharacterized protein n=1 Tax=Marivirga aurantiaca TaxID=2802615 RepID=A0A934WX71_9BACT|nr:hypothetical protein [Marivirga aurantiaca]MBK6264764.1 hypothetical protein [Marivirga aurantiaca]